MPVFQSAIDAVPNASSVATARQEQWAKLAIGAVFLSMCVAALLAFRDDRFRNTGEGNSIREILYVACFVAALVGARGFDVSKLLAIPLSLSVTLAFCWLSLSWSAAPGVGFRRLLLTNMIILTVFMTVPLLSYEETLKTIKKIMIFALVANYVAVIFFPRIGIHQPAEVAGFGIDRDLIGSWKGILSHKNMAGPFCAFSIMFFILDAGSTKRVYRILIILANLIFLIKSHSKTSAGLMVVAIFIAWAYRFYNPRYRSIVVPLLALTVCAVGIIVYVDWDTIWRPFNRPDAFSGRVQIWKVVVRYYLDHPRGTGFGSFWNIGVDRPVLHYVAPKNWVGGVPEAHNGYLDLLVQIGMLGMVLTVLSLVVVPIGRLMTSLTAPREQSSLLVGIIAFCAGHNLTESSFLDRDQIVEMFLLLAIALIGVVCRPPERPSLSRGTALHV